MENPSAKIKEWLDNKKIPIPSVHIVLGSGARLGADET